MGISRLGCAGLAVLATGLLLAGCPGPTYDRTLLKGVKAEARVLMLRYARQPELVLDVPESEWPPAIGRLKPDLVWVEDDGVYIFDPMFSMAAGAITSRRAQGGI